ncbi:MAG: MJ0042-type zinc finger domain-containing protein [Candidatus Deferrimicrobiaceae bacterium]
MVVECSICQARYRMRESMMRGFQGAEVRCRKCGGIIVIMNTATVPGPAVPAAPAGETRAHRQPSPPGERSGIPPRKEHSSPEHARRGPPAGERKAQPGTALAEETDIEEAVPDNVYSLEHFREIRPRRSPADGFDISGYIRPEPSAPFPEAEPDSSSTPPPEAPVEKDPTADSILYESVAWQKEGILPPPGADPVPPSREAGPPRGFFSRKERPRSPTLHPMFPRISDIAFVYLLLLLAGGVGYLVVRLIAPLFASRFPY